MINFSKAPTNENLTPMLMKSFEGGYFESLKFIEAIFFVSKEPRIFKYSNNISYVKTRGDRKK